ncbi:MAG TPA: hypothetical protein VGC11_08755 [Acidimicrobiia bacterium]
MQDHLRPLERRVLAMRDDGLSVDDIAIRIRRSPRLVERIIAWTELPRSGPHVSRLPRAIERRVLVMRSEGHSYDAIGKRFGRAPRSIRQIEGLAHFRLAIDLLS